MYGEFFLAKDLVHPNIVKYEYFMHQFNELEQTYEFHNIIEFMDGADMDVYLKEQGKPFFIEKI